MSSWSDTGAIVIGVRIATGTTGTPTVPAGITAGATIDIPGITAIDILGITAIGVIPVITAIAIITIGDQE